jgi:hypothetical protein
MSKAAATAVSCGAVRPTVSDRHLDPEEHPLADMIAAVTNTADAATPAADPRVVNTDNPR